MATRTLSAAGGTRNWNDTLSWVEGAVPTSADDVVANVTSGALTINAAAACRSIDVNGYTGTITHNTGITLSIGDGTAGTGNRALRFVSGMTYSPADDTAAISFVSTSATQQTIAWGGKTPGNVTVSGAGGSWSVSDAFSTRSATTTTLTLTNGILNTNGQTCAWGKFALGSGTKTLTLGASSVTLAGGATAWNASTNGTNFTLNANTSSITLSGASATFAGNGKTYNNVTMSGGGTGLTVSGTNTFANFTCTGTASKTDLITFSANQTVTGVMTFTGNSAANRLHVTSNTIGTAVTFTLTGATLTNTNVDFMDVTVSGTPTQNTTSVGNALGNSGITFTAGTTLYWFKDSGNWSDSSKWFLGSGGTGGAGRAPLPQDNVVFDAASFSAGAQTITMDMPRAGTDITATAVTNSPGFTSTTVSINWYGSWAYATTVIGSNTQGFNARGRGSHTINFGNRQLSTAILAPGGTYTLAANLNNGGGNFTVTAGTFDAAGFTVTAVGFISTGSVTRAAIMGSGLWTMTATTATAVWNTASGSLTLTITNAALRINGSAANTATQTITTGGVSMPPTQIGTPGALTGQTIQLLDGFTGNITLAGAVFDFNGQTISGTLTLNGGTLTNSTGTATVTTLTVGLGTTTIVHGKTITVTTLGGEPAAPTGWDADDFTRGDSSTSLGTTSERAKTWSQSVASRWGIASNKAYFSDTSNSGFNTAWVDEGTADGVLICDVILSGTANRARAGVCFRHDGNGQATANYLEFRIAVVSGTTDGSLGKIESGTRTALNASTGWTPVVGTTYRVKAVFAGNAIDIYVDGILRCSYTLTTAEQTKFGAWTKHGLANSQSATADDGGSRWDNCTFVSGAALESDLSASAATISCSATTPWRNVFARDITVSGAGASINDLNGYNLSGLLGVGANSGINFIRTGAGLSRCGARIGSQSSVVRTNSGQCRAGGRAGGAASVLRTGTALARAAGRAASSASIVRTGTGRARSGARECAKASVLRTGTGSTRAGARAQALSSVVRKGTATVRAGSQVRGASSAIRNCGGRSRSGSRLVSASSVVRVVRSSHARGGSRTGTILLVVEHQTIEFRAVHQPRLAAPARLG